MQFDNLGLVVAPVRWYFAPPGALPMPFNTPFGTSNWLVSGTEPDPGPGELLTTDRAWNNGATPSWAVGTGKYCGPDDWWQNGSPPDAPPVILDPTGQPTCCISRLVDTEPVAYKWRAKTFGCAPWNSHLVPAGVQVFNLTTSTAWTLDVNTTSSLRARDPAHTSNFVSAASLGSCQGFTGMSATITFTFGGTPQTGALKLLSWNPVNGRSVWQVPTTFFLYGGQYFAITRPLS